MKIKIKSLLVSALLVIMIAGVFLMHNLFVPEKTQGFYYAALLYCPVNCTFYAFECPVEVRRLCMSDCLDICLHPPVSEQ